MMCASTRVQQYRRSPLTAQGAGTSRQPPPQSCQQLAEGYAALRARHNLFEAALRKVHSAGKSNADLRKQKDCLDVLEQNTKR